MNNNASLKLRLNRSFTSRVAQGDEQVKSVYNEIKNELLSYEGLKNIVGWSRDRFLLGRHTLAKIGFKRKAICLFLAAPLDAIDTDKFEVENISALKSAGKMTFRMRITSEEGAKYASRVIAATMAANNVLKGGAHDEDWTLPYADDEELIARQLIKVRQPKEATDEAAATAKEKKPAKKKEEKKEQPAEVIEDKEEKAQEAESVVEEKVEESARKQEEETEEPSDVIEEKAEEPTQAEEPAEELEETTEEASAQSEAAEEPIEEAEEETEQAEEQKETEEETAEETAEEEETAEKAEESKEESEEDLTDSSKYLLRVRGLKKYFPIKKDFFGRPTAQLRAVDNVSFDLERGKTLGIVGESGCGKTTMGRTILKLHEPTGGKVYFDGVDVAPMKPKQLRPLRTRMQIIFQDPYSSLPPRMPVGEIIGEAVKCHNLVPKSELRDYVLDIMDKCGLRDYYYERYPHEFSGGQRQRICIARALAVKPELIVCDEPVSALDVSIQAQIINLLKDLQESMKLTYLFISHDLSVVKHISDNVGVMYLGSMVEFGTNKSIFHNPMHPYTRALFSAVPVPDPKVKMNRILLSGDIPSPANPPSGCKFHTRCPNCMDVCKEVAPVYKEYEPEHFVACHLYPQD